MNQEKNPENMIKEFVKKFNVDFQLFSRIEVNGENAHPVYKYLRANSEL